jgi:hypothetical protein
MRFSYRNRTTGEQLDRHPAEATPDRRAEGTLDIYVRAHDSPVTARVELSYSETFSLASAAVEILSATDRLELIRRLAKKL